jgi:hypothetical protein
MPTLAKAAILSLSLLTGVGFAAQAQQSNIAALPPGAMAAPPAAPTRVGPSANYPGPDPGRNWSTSERQTQPVQPSGNLMGPDPGRNWSVTEHQTGPVMPSPKYVGPAPN